jgi:hypothetical protein
MVSAQSTILSLNVLKDDLNKSQPSGVASWHFSDKGFGDQSAQAPIVLIRHWGTSDAIQRACPGFGRTYAPAPHTSPQIGLRKQRDELRGVLFQSPVVHLDIELALDHLNRVLSLGSGACLELFHLVDGGIYRFVFVRCPAQVRAHGDVPCDVGLGIGALLNALLACIAPSKIFASVQQAVAFCHVMHIARVAAYGVHQA